MVVELAIHLAFSNACLLVSAIVDGVNLLPANGGTDEMGD